jgi:PIN domain nuclease of toxin-antitoxin system
VKLLLDTHYVFGLAGSPGALLKKEASFLDEFLDPFVISSVSIWEIRLKWHSFHASGERKGPLSPQQVLDALSIDPVAEFLPLTLEHAATVLDVGLAHRDPFDDLLLVQAQVEGLKLLTRDRKLIGHPLVQTIA